MNERIDWGRVLAGDPDPWRAGDAWAQKAAEHAEQRAAFDAAVEADPEWKQSRARAAEMAAYIAGRGNWIGTPSCDECAVEQRAADDGKHVQIEKVDHGCWVEDQRIQQRLLDQVRIRRAEADGGLRTGTFYDGRPTNDTGRQMAVAGAARQVAVGVAHRLGPG